MKFKAKTKVSITVETYFEAPLKGFDEKNGYKETIKEQALNALKDYFSGNELNEQVKSINIKTEIKGADTE